MGIWGYTIFGNDITCDLRDKYKDFIESGHTSDEATQKLLQKYSSIMKEEEYYNSVIYLALASLQLETGNVSSEIKEKSLKIINDDRYIISDDYQLKLRKKEYIDLKTKLLKLK